MDRRTQRLRQWLTAPTEREATDAVIALAMEEMTARDAERLSSESKEEREDE